MHTHILQNILEKFEYFPIKCRVQRSSEIFNKTWERKKAANELETPWKQKVFAVDLQSRLSASL